MKSKVGQTHLALAVRTLGDVLRHADLRESERCDLEAIAEDLRAVLNAAPSEVWMLDERGTLRNGASEALAHFPWSLGDASDRARAQLACSAPVLYRALYALLNEVTTAPMTAAQRAGWAALDYAALCEVDPEPERGWPTVGELAAAATGGDLDAMAALLNQHGGSYREHPPKASELVSPPLVRHVAEQHAGDAVGVALAALLDARPGARRQGAQ